MTPPASADPSAARSGAPGAPDESAPASLVRLSGHLTRPSVLLRAGGGAALVVLMFATRWYGLSTPAHGSFGAAGATAVGVWSTLSVVRWLLLAAVAAGALSLLLPRGRVADLALALGLVATAALFYRMLIVLPDPHAVLDVKIGGYLALVACAALTFGAYEAEAGAAAQVEPHPQVID